MAKRTLKELKKMKNEMLGFDPENYEECLAAVKRNGNAIVYVRDLSMLENVDF